MININTGENPYIDPDNRIEREIGGCNVRLFFNMKRNEKAERLVLDNLMLAFDRKMHGLSNVQSQDLHLRQPHVHQV